MSTTITVTCPSCQKPFQATIPEGGAGVIVQYSKEGGVFPKPLAAKCPHCGQFSNHYPKKV